MGWVGGWMGRQRAGTTNHTVTMLLTRPRRAFSLQCSSLCLTSHRASANPSSGSSSFLRKSCIRKKRKTSLIVMDSGVFSLRLETFYFCVGLVK